MDENKIAGSIKEAKAPPKRPSARFSNAVGGLSDAVRDAAKKP